MKLLFLILTVISVAKRGNLHAQNASSPGPLLVHKCQDFNITGNGSNAEWNKTTWTALIKLDTGGMNYETKFKILYSSKGIYLFFEGEDNKITTRFDKDFDELYNGDVFEAFFHAGTSNPLYFEYEINHLNKELVLLVANLNGRFSGWIPWQYEKERKIKKMVNIVGGKMEPGALIKSWNAEIFFPFALVAPLSNIPPASGTVWNANFYRLDYDSGNMVKWAWAPIDHSFHEFEKFGPIRFE